MTCERHYTPTAIAEMQRITASIEAERRRKYRAEMAQELRERVAECRRTYADPTQYDQDHVVAIARLILLWQFEEWVNELSPPVREPTAEAGWLPARKIVVCDDSTE